MNKSTFKRAVLLVLPLLLFLILFIPYSYINNEFIVKWFGCGCPQFDEITGETVKNNFNANTFTKYFWLFISLCVTVISAFLTKLLPRKKFGSRYSMLFQCLWFLCLYHTNSLI